MNNNKTTPAQNGTDTTRQREEKLNSKIRTIRFIILSTILYFLTDAIGRWFLPQNESIPGLYSIILWVLCFITGALQFFLWRKTLNIKWLKWTTLTAYTILFAILLGIGGFYNYGKAAYIGYKISITIMPLWGFLIESTFTRFLKWYGNLIKQTLHLNSVNNVVFMLCMLLPIALILLLFIGSYRLAGTLSRHGSDIQQLITEGEINHNTDHSEPVRQYDRLFNDLNDVQLKAARKNGLKNPITESQAGTNRHLVEIKPNTYYDIDKLTHSIPYLVPKAAQLLEEMGRAFQDSLFQRGYNRNHRFTVTSVLRTNEHVKQLRRVNQNSSANSCHRYGTTFDISYFTYSTPHVGKTASTEKMRQILYQVVYDMQRQDRCYVKYEKQQTCLHITVR